MRVKQTKAKAGVVEFEEKIIKETENKNQGNCKGRDKKSFKDAMR